MAQPQRAKITHDHKEILSWVMYRGGVPIIIESESDDPTKVLRINFPGERRGRGTKKAKWDDFFNVMDKEEINFLFQDKTPEGDTSLYYKFVNR